MVLIAGFRARLAGLNLGYPENPAKLGSLIFSYVGFNLVSRAFKDYELGLTGLAGFEKIKVGFSWVFWVSNIL